MQQHLIELSVGLKLHSVILGLVMPDGVVARLAPTCQTHTTQPCHATNALTAATVTNQMHTLYVQVDVLLVNPPVQPITRPRIIATLVKMENFRRPKATMHRAKIAPLGHQTVVLGTLIARVVLPVVV